MANGSENQSSVNVVQHLVVAITFKNSAERLQWLRQVAAGLDDLAVTKTIVVVTDSLEMDGVSEEKLREVFHSGEVEVTVPSHIGHPLLLPWFHHDVFLEKFRADKQHSHFLYLEDDTLFTAKNLHYWLRARPLLRSHGLVPGFLRVEQQEPGVWVSSDVYRSAHLRNLPRLRAGSETYVNLRYPYQASYLMDRELFAEFREASTFNPDFRNWNIREKASRGLLYEKVPSGCFSRSFLPFISGHGIPDEAWIHHLPNNYALQDRNKYGSVPVPNLVRERGSALLERTGEEFSRLLSGRKPRRRKLYLSTSGLGSHGARNEKN